MSAFARPEWLALFPFLAFAAWRWPALGWRRPLRAACLVLLATCLAAPRWPGSSGVDLWVLVDRSASARELVVPRLSELEMLLQRSKGRADRLFFVDFAAEARVREGAGEGPNVSVEATRTSAAVLAALQRAQPNRATRLLLLTDGYATEPLTPAIERLQAQGATLDYRLFEVDQARDFRLDALEAPLRVQAGEPFLVELRVSGPRDADVPVVVRRDGHEVAHVTAHVRGGRAVVRLRDRLEQGGAYHLTADLHAPDDPLPGNDRSETWVEVAAGPRVLLVTSLVGDPVADVLRKQGFEVEQAPLEQLSVGRLSGARAVILDNVPAYALPSAFLDGLDTFVRVQGGGLLMAGGRFSFGSGGYFGSRIDALLPVSMELRSEHRRLVTALVLVLDRSGSMAADVGHGVTKMDLADEGAARSIELLGSQDGVSVIAVDSEAHVVVPLGLLGAERVRVVDLVRRIDAGGGGIFIHAGLQAAWRQLRSAPLGQRHVILFADAADSEEPGDYQQLLREMVAGGATVSVIALGTPADSDAELLRDIAKRGKGRIFFNADPGTLPALFAQETVAVARSAFLAEPVAARSTSGWLQIAARPLARLDGVDGYNLSYLRPQATAGVLSRDTYEAPLVAFWQRGAGRVAAVTFPLGGEHSARVRASTAYEDLLQTLGRWLMSPALPAGIGLRTRVEGAQLTLDLLFDERWQASVARHPPELLLAEGTRGEPRALQWQRLAPGHLSVSQTLPPGTFHRGAVRLAEGSWPFGPITIPGSAEWAFDERRRDELRLAAAESGGLELGDLRAAWRPPARTPGTRDLRPLLLWLTLVLFLVEILRARVGLPRFAWRWPRRWVRSSSGPSMVDEQADEERGQRFRRAKRR